MTGILDKLTAPNIFTLEVVVKDILVCPTELEARLSPTYLKVTCVDNLEEKRAEIFGTQVKPALTQIIQLGTA